MACYGSMNEAPVSVQSWTHVVCSKHTPCVAGSSSSHAVHRSHGDKFGPQVSLVFLLPRRTIVVSAAVTTMLASQGDVHASQYPDVPTHNVNVQTWPHGAWRSKTERMPAIAGVVATTMARTTSERRASDIAPPDTPRYRNRSARGIRDIAPARAHRREPGASYRPAQPSGPTGIPAGQRAYR